MELHFIADDLEDHVWYVDLVADFVEDVERFVYLAQVSESARADSDPREDP